MHNNNKMLPKSRAEMLPKSRAEMRQKNEQYSNTVTQNEQSIQTITPVQCANDCIVLIPPTSMLVYPGNMLIYPDNVRIISSASVQNHYITDNLTNSTVLFPRFTVDKSLYTQNPFCNSSRHIFY